MTDAARSLWPPFTKPPACAGCPLERRGGPFVPGWGRLDARLIIVAERPGGCEDGSCTCPMKAHLRGRPLVGKTGKAVHSALRNDLSDTFLTNVRKCQVGNESPAEKATSIAHCTAAYLQVEMDAISEAQRAAGVDRGAVLAIGADATKVLLARTNMQKYHGTFWTRAERDAMCATAEGAARGDADELGEDSDIPF